MQTTQRPAVSTMSRQELEQEVVLLRQRVQWLEREKDTEAIKRQELALQVQQAKDRLSHSKAKLKEVVDDTVSGLQVSTISALNNNKSILQETKQENEML